MVPNEKEGLEAEFRNSIDQMLERIVAAPLRFGPVRGEVRRAFTTTVSLRHPLRA
jgi:hypothetical protein